jgi:cytidine deaminase
MAQLAASSISRTVPVSALKPLDQELCRKAAEAARAAYAPYSNFSVGAAVRTKHAIYLGSNLENASYGVTICAEVSAITSANSAGDLDIAAIAIVGYPSNSAAAGTNIVTPCGRCRQIIFEASQVSGIDIRVICCNGDLSKCRPYVISELLPDAFGPANLNIDLSAYRSKKLPR